MERGGLKTARIPRLEGHWSINGLRPAGNQQGGQSCRDQFCGPCQPTSHQWPGQRQTLYANKFANDIKIGGGWGSMPNGRASIRRTLLGLRTGPEDTSWGSIEVQRSAPGAEKSHVQGTARQQPWQKAAGTYGGCQAAKEPIVCSHGNMGDPILRYTGRECGKPTNPRDPVLVKFHRLSKSYNLDRSPPT